MTTALSEARIQELLRHEGFLRKTLRDLLASEEDVQDVLQQTWLRVLERPATEPERPRTWLARVARNQVARVTTSTSPSGTRPERTASGAASSAQRSRPPNSRSSWPRRRAWARE